MTSLPKLKIEQNVDINEIKIEMRTIKTVLSKIKQKVKKSNKLVCWSFGSKYLLHRTDECS